MSALGSLCSHLKNDSGVTGQLSAATEVYIDVAPQERGDKFITVSQLPGTEHQHHQGGSSGLVRKQFQVTCWAVDPLDAETIADKVRLAVDGLTRGTLGTSPNNMTVTEVRVEDEHSHYVEPDAGKEVGTHGWIMTISIWHTETKPSV